MAERRGGQEKSRYLERFLQKGQKRQRRGGAVVAAEVDSEMTVTLNCRQKKKVRQRGKLQPVSSVTRLGDILDFGQLFKAFGNN